MERIRSSFFIRLLVLSCFLGIFPLAAVGYLSYNKSSDIVQQEVTQGNLLILQQNRANVEHLLRTTEVLTIQMVQTPLNADAISLESALRLPHTSEHRKTFEQLIHRMVQIQVFELGISEVNVMSFHQNWLIDRSIVHALDTLNHEWEWDAYIARLSNQLLHNQHDNELSNWSLSDTQRNENTYVIKLFKSIPLNALHPDGVITVNIPLREIHKRMTHDERLGMMMVTDEKGRVISHSDESQIGSDLSDQRFYQRIKERMEMTDPFIETMDDEKYTVIHDQSAYNGWSYISLIPLSSMLEESNAIKGYTLIISFLIVLAVILFSVFASRRMSSPIRDILRFISSEAPAHHKIGNELDYIGNQVKGMAQLQHRMAGQIEGLNRQAREYFVMKLVRGEIKPSDIEERLDNFGFTADWDHWCMFAIQIDTLDHTRYSEEDRDLLMFAIHNMVEEMVPMEKRLSPIVMNQTLFIVIGKQLDDSKPFKVDMFSMAEQIQEKVKHYLEIIVSIGISRIHESLNHVPLAHQESIDALTYRIRLGQQMIMFLDEVQPENQQYVPYPKELESLLLEAVKQQDLEEAKDFLEQMLTDGLQKYANPSDFHFFLGRLFNNLVGIVQDEGGSIHEVFQANHGWPDELGKLNASTEINIWMEQQVLIPLIHWLKEKRTSQEMNISEEILTMIHEEYDKDLTIELCAARLHFHPSYISRVFKKETGVTFSKSLSDYRMAIAKRWLKETDMKISEIAEKLRYSNSSNFNRNFKKSEQMTPTQYRFMMNDEAAQGSRFNEDA